MTFAKKAAIVGILAVCAVCVPAWSAQYTNISNEPFNTISNGPQNAVIVKVTNPADKAQVKAALTGATSTITRASSNSALSRMVAAMRKSGRMRSDQRPSIYANVLVTSQSGITRSSRAPESYGGGEITFTYENWTADQVTLLQNFAALAYPIVKQIYGNPARTITVKVMKDNTLGAAQAQIGGLYVTGAETSPEIRIFNTQGRAIDIERDFLYLMIRAFHDTASFDYDVWEDGFTRAAAVAAGELIDRQIALTHPAELVELDLVGRGLGGGSEFFYQMATYEVLNQPALSNNKFAKWDSAFQGDDWGGMIIPRLGMSSTAWLKAYIERLRQDGESFFKLFNDSYYAQLSTSATLPSNVPSLKAIAAGITPTLEGAAFNNWFSKQYVFDTSVSVGKKLYAYVFPPNQTSSESSGDYSQYIYLVHYLTDGLGSETPLSTTIYPSYWNYNYTEDIYLSPQYETITIDNGFGAVSPTFFVDNIGGPQRIAMDFTATAETVRAYFAAGKAGTPSAANNVTGCIIGANDGSVSIRVGADVTNTAATVTKGAFGTYLPSLVDFDRMTITYTPASGDPVTKVVNVGPGTYVALVKAASSGTTVSHTFESGFRMISVPVTPLAQNQADALKDPFGNPILGSNQLLLARWNPQAAGSYKYEMYPKTPAFAPGRGYWAKFANNINVTVTGELADPTSVWRIGLAQGWNQVGGPFNAAVPIDSLLVKRGTNDPITFAEAWQQGLIGRVFWKYVPGSPYVESTTLDPWEGYWIKCNVADGLILMVPGPNNTSFGRRATRTASVPSGAGKAASVPKGSWQFTLSASSTNGGNPAAVKLGVAPGASSAIDNALDAEAPPAFGSGLSMVSVTPVGPASPLAVDTRAVGTAKTDWDVVVTPSSANEDIVLRWQDIGSIPGKSRLSIRDQQTGRSQYIRTTSSYRFNSGDGSPRRFTITADSSPASRLIVSNVMVSPTRGTNMTFSYNLSTDAQVSVDIMSSNGRVVRRIESGSPTRSGISSSLWDKRDEDGRSVPAGMYVIQIKAATEEGEMVKTIRPVMISR